MEDKFKVLIDAKKIQDGGIGAYLQNLICGLLQVGTIDISLLGKKEVIDNFPWSKEVNVIECDFEPYSLKESLRIKNVVDFSKYDLFHSPHYTLPFGINIPTVVTIHDIIHIKNPKKSYYPFIAHLWINSSLKRASQVITVSKASKNDLIKEFKYARKNPDKISVIPNTFSVNSVINNDLNREYKFPYFISIFSNTMPHKGLDDLIYAYKRLEKECGKGNIPKLIIAGFGIEKLLNEDKIKDFDVSNNVIFLGKISEEKKRSLILNSKAMLIPSLLEGFCFQALDAQSLKVPFIFRPVPAIKEIATRCDFCAKSMKKEDFFGEIKNFYNITQERDLNYSIKEAHFDKYKLENVIEATLRVYSKASNKEIKKKVAPLQEAI